MKRLGYMASVVAMMVASGLARAQVTNDSVKLGVLTDMSSIFSDGVGRGSVVAAQMAADDVGGKVLGKPVEVVFADHQNKPDTGAGIARAWFDRDGVDVILDIPVSSVALAVQKLAQDKNRVVLLSGAGASDLTGPACTETTLQWTYNTYALAAVAGKAAVARGDNSWFFVTADYAFGKSLERDATEAVKGAGGKVLGEVRHPINSPDLSSFLVQAQSSGAKAIALANAGGDTQTAIKQASEFGIQQGGQKLVALLLNLMDVKSLGLPVAKGMILSTAFYWDVDDKTRDFANRFLAKHKRMPTMYQAGVYSSAMHYLKAVQAAGTDEAKAVVAKMKEMPVDDFFARGGRVREDGLLMHNFYLAEVKEPSASKGEWDLYNILATVPADQAFQPLSQSQCPRVTAK